MIDGLRVQLVKMMVGLGCKLESGKVDVDFVGGYGCIVHGCPIVEYVTESFVVPVFQKKMFFDHFPV